MENDNSNLVAVIALFIACFSMIIGAISLGWNIYKEIIFKPKLIVNLGVSVLVGGGAKETIISLRGVNSFQGSVTVNIPVLKKTGYFRKLFKCEKNWIINPDHSHPYCSALHAN